MSGLDFFLPVYIYTLESSLCYAKTRAITIEAALFGKKMSDWQAFQVSIYTRCSRNIVGVIHCQLRILHY